MKPVRPVAAPGALAALTLAVAAAHLLVLRAWPDAFGPTDPVPPRAAPLLTRRIDAPAPPAPLAVPPVPPPPRAAPRPAPRPTPAPATPSPAPPTATAVAPAPAPESQPEPATAPPSPPAAPPAPAPPASSGPPPATETVDLDARVAPPMRLLYEVSGQARQLPYAARGELLWSHDGHHYRARLEIGAFLLGARVQTSEGELAAGGLAPRRFADRSRSEQAAHFDREAGRIRYSANTPDAPLLPGAQDRLSLLLQLGAVLAANPARRAPGSTLTLQTSGAREAEPWLVQVAGPETLDLPAGPLEAWRLVREPRRPYDTRMELWLAPSLGWLPVRVRLTQANGDTVDQRLRASEPLTP